MRWLEQLDFRLPGGVAALRWPETHPNFRIFPASCLPVVSISSPRAVYRSGRGLGALENAGGSGYAPTIQNGLDGI